MIGKLPVWDSITTAWKKTDGAKGSVWAAVGIMVLIIFALGILAQALPMFAWLIDTVKKIAGMLLQTGIVFMGIEKYRGKPISYPMVFRNFETWMALRLIGLFFLEVLIMLPFIAIMAVCFITNALPLALNILIAILCIIGIIYVRVRMILGLGYVLDRNMNPWLAIKASFAVTKNHVLELFSIYVLFLAIVIISMIPLGIGLIWTIPMGVLLYGLLYNELTKQ